MQRLSCGTVVLSAVGWDSKLLASQGPARAQRHSVHVMGPDDLLLVHGPWTCCMGTGPGLAAWARALDTSLVQDLRSWT
eukprot:366145-Chlamydomonas_euryale.AAC.2